mgnify:CR=1 FL=1
MSKSNKLKIFNDPIYGFITIPNTLVFDLIAHPYFQRLRRISQMGLSYLVYPGAHHTRFHHALGSMHLMGRAIQTLRFKGVAITEAEEQCFIEHTASIERWSGFIETYNQEGQALELDPYFAFSF